MTYTKHFIDPDWVFENHNEAAKMIEQLRETVENLQFHNRGLQQAKIEAVRLLDFALCPCCDKSGAYYDNYGQVQQCQWCYEVEQLKEQAL